MSVVTIGTATLRMLNPTPSLVLLNLATYTYTMLPFYRELEVATRDKLLKEGQLDGYILMGLGNVLLLGIGRYFTAAFGMGVIYVGEELRARANETAQKQLASNLFNHLFDPHQQVWVLVHGVEVEVPLNQVQRDDILVVKVGETIPVDGVVVEGMVSVDQHAFTGESYPVEKGVGETVFASTLVLTGKLFVRVEKSGQETTIAKIGDILAHTQHAKTKIQLHSEQWADAANLPFLGLATGGLVIAGPVGAAVILGGNTIQAMRVLAPLATINYQTVASHQLILVKQGQCLERFNSIDTLLFDKTGTLTDGELEVRRLLVVSPDCTEAQLLFYAALAEHQLTHPIAKAIMRYAMKAGVNVENLDEVEYRFGYGIAIQFENQMIHVGSARFMTVEGIALFDSVNQLQTEIHQQGHSLVMVAINRQVAGIIELQATLRPEVQAVFKELRNRGIRHISIVSGDHATPTQKLAEYLGADSYFAEVLPEDKARIVKQFQAQGHNVGFVGDGVNDTIAMQQADLSISLRGTTTLATDVADIILLDPNLTRLCDLMELSRRLETNLKRGIGLCYVGMVTVVVGTFFAHIDIITAMLVHFTMGSVSVGNSMLPLTEIDLSMTKPQALTEVDQSITKLQRDKI